MEFLDQIPQWVLLAIAAIAGAFGLHTRLPWIFQAILGRLTPEQSADTRPDAFQALTLLMQHVDGLKCPKLKADCEAAFQTLAKAVIRAPGYQPTDEPTPK